MVALQNKSVDAALAIEPAPTIAVRNGSAVVVAGDDEISPYHQIAVLLYSESFAANRPELARKFMRAYLRAVRFYNDALQGGHLAGLNADELISILTEYAAIKDPAIYRAITPTGMNPDGEVNVRSLAHDLAFYQRAGTDQGRRSISTQLLDRELRRRGGEGAGTVPAVRPVVARSAATKQSRPTSACVRGTRLLRPATQASQ